MDKITVREVVTYDCCTANGLHDTSHNGANCFIHQVANPTKKDIPNKQGYLRDNHQPFNIAAPPYWTSYCQATQIYQWAKDWPEAPHKDDESQQWQTIATHSISRYIEYVNGQWQYRIKKGGDECTMILQ